MQTVRDYDDKLRERVVPHAQTYDPSYNKDTATPPDSKPVLDKKITDKVGGENIGFEEFDEEIKSKNRDFKAILKSFLKPIFGGTEKREGPEGKIWNKEKNLKLKRSGEAVDKNDPDQELE